MLHPREIQLLNAMAKLGEPATAQEIGYEAKISQSTVQAVIRKMLTEGYIESIGFTYSGNVLSRQFVLTDKVKEDILKQMVDFYSSIEAIVSVEDVYNELQKNKNV